MKSRKSVCRYIARLVTNRQKTVSLLFGVCLSGCLACGSNNPENNTNEVTIPNQQTVDTTSETVFEAFDRDRSCGQLAVEIVSSEFGMVPHAGNTIFGRILWDGRVEYDTKSPPADTSRKTTRLSKAELSHLITLLKKGESLPPAAEFAIGDPCLDALYRKVVTFCVRPGVSHRVFVFNECRPLVGDSHKPPEFAHTLISFVGAARK